jgi:hypothetical protein
MNLYQRTIEILDKRFRLGHDAARPKQLLEALAQATEERLRAIEEQLLESKGGESK